MQNYVTEAGHPQILEVTASSALNALFNTKNYSEFETSCQKLKILVKYLNWEAVKYTKGEAMSLHQK